MRDRTIPKDAIKVTASAFLLGWLLEKDLDVNTFPQDSSFVSVAMQVVRLACKRNEKQHVPRIAFSLGLKIVYPIRELERPGAFYYGLNHVREPGVAEKMGRQGVDLNGEHDDLTHRKLQLIVVVQGAHPKLPVRSICCRSSDFSRHDKASSLNLPSTTPGQQFCIVVYIPSCG